MVRRSDGRLGNGGGWYFPDDDAVSIGITSISMYEYSIDEICRMNESWNILFLFAKIPIKLTEE